MINRQWLFDRPGRPQRVLMTAAVVGMAAILTVLWVRVDQMSSHGGSDPLAGSTTAPSTPSADQRLATPAPVPTSTVGDLGSGQPDQQITPAADGGLSTTSDGLDNAFTDLGDPRPTALRAVRHWLAGENSALDGDLLPGVLDEALANPPAPKTTINGTAYVSEPGPTESVVIVPTTNGKLTVTLVVVNRQKWMIESMGWGAQ